MTENPKERDEKGKLLPGHEIRKQSGAWLWLRTARVPEIKGSRRLRKHLTDLKTRLQEVIPGSEDPRRQVIINQVIKCEGFLVLIESYLKKAGIINPTALQQGRLETQGALNTCVSFLNCQLRSLQALGMDSKEGLDTLDLGRYVEMKDKEKAAKEGEVSK